MYRYRSASFYIRIIIAILLSASILGVLIVPMFFGGASPAQRIRRVINGDNAATALLDASAVVMGCKNGIFDFEKNGIPGVLTYDIDLKNNRMECYWVLQDSSNPQAKYILMKDGIRYSFSMDADGWQYDGKNTEYTNFKRLFSGIGSVLADREVDVTALEHDLNGLTGLDLSNYFEFAAVPTVMRSIVKAFDEDNFQSAIGYSFQRDGLDLTYSFKPANNKAFADRFNALLQPAYTSKTQTIVNLAGLAGGIADMMGYDLYSLLFNTELSFSIDAISGKLTFLHITTDHDDYRFTSRKYCGCKINIDSPSLEALIILNTEN